MNLLRNTRHITLFACPLFAACAITTTDLGTVRREIASVRACCSSIASLPTSAPLLTEQLIAFGPSSPHFDFGMGLAPFALYRIDSAKYPASIEVFSTSQGFEPGRVDRSVHYADARVLFYTATMMPVTSPPFVPEPQAKKSDFAGGYKLERMYQVPNGAAFFVVTTDAAAIGTQGSLYYGEASQTVAAGGAFISVPRGAVVGKTKSTPYGEILVRIIR
jgi:hypothetical protein